MVYSRKIADKVFTFGISGRLYKSNVLLYDHQSESLWSQLMEKAIAGPMVGTKLKKVVSVRLKWKSWRQKQQNTLVLSDDTGFDRDYATDPYEGYYRLGSLMFPVGDVRTDLPTKERILGLTVQGVAKAYAIAKISRQPGIIEDEIGDTFIRIHIGAGGEITDVTGERGESIPHIFSYWFAWQAFYPETVVYIND